VGLILDQMFELSGRISEYQEEFAALHTENEELRLQISASNRAKQLAEEATQEIRMPPEKQTEAIVLISASEPTAANIETELPGGPPSSETTP
jgi:hypothetical protein